VPFPDSAQAPPDSSNWKYLYVGAGGNLYQPEGRGARTDVTDADCDAAKLKHKAKAGVV
jgi:hypothetical protein